MNHLRIESFYTILYFFLNYVIFVTKYVFLKFKHWTFDKDTYIDIT